MDSLRDRVATDLLWLCDDDADRVSVRVTVSVSDVDVLVVRDDDRSRDGAWPFTATFDADTVTVCDRE